MILFQWLRSLVFVVQIYAMMLFLGILFAPLALVSKSGAKFACKVYCAWVLWSARWMVGIKTEIRGIIPTDEVVVASKHQSFLDILILFGHMPWPKFIMKRELMWTPVIGLYAKRLGCVPVNRGKGGAAIAKMVQDVAKEFAEPGQLVIYPQGTRVAPGAHKPYKIGAAVLYEQLNQPCIPVATNVGLFWPRTGILRKPGTAVVEFLDPIPAGLPKPEFMKILEDRVEARSNALMKEAGFDPNGLHQHN